MLLYAALFFSASAGFLIYFTRNKTLAPATVWTVFGAGLVSGPLSGIAEYFFEQAFLSGPGAPRESMGAAVFYLLGVGPLEELAKFLAVFLAALRRQDFRSSYDGILLAVCAALGFAGGENVVYLLSFGPEATIARLFFGNLGHASFSAVWGYALGVALHENAEFAVVLEGLLISALLHGLYDFLLTFSTPGYALAMLLMSGMILFLFVFMRKERQRNAKRPRSPTGAAGAARNARRKP